jgi:hypothetical protein
LSRTGGAVASVDVEFRFCASASLAFLSPDPSMKVKDLNKVNKINKVNKVNILLDFLWWSEFFD